MNKQIFMITAVFFGLLTSVSCSSDDDSNNSNTNAAQIQAAVTAATNGTWRISNFIDSGQNETSDFDGYDFTFASNGTLTATNGTLTQTGTWSVTDDSNSSDDDSSNDDDIDFNISFPVSDTNNFEDLNDDWDVVSTSDTQISLIDISGGNGGTDILVFNRN